MRQLDVYDTTEMHDGIALSTSFELLEGSLIGTCDCGVEVRVPMVETNGLLECDGCGSTWRLKLYPQVQRA